MYHSAKLSRYIMCASILTSGDIGDALFPEFPEFIVNLHGKPLTRKTRTLRAASTDIGGRVVVGVVGAAVVRAAHSTAATRILKLSIQLYPRVRCACGVGELAEIGMMKRDMNAQFAPSGSCKVLERG